MSTSHASGRMAWMLQLIALTTLNVFVFFAFMTYHPGDPGWAIVQKTSSIHNAEGMLGAWFADLAFFVFGLTALFLPLGLTLINIRQCQRLPVWRTVSWQRCLQLIFGTMLVVSAAACLFAMLLPISFMQLPAGPGGIIGQTIAWVGLGWLHQVGLLLIAMAALAMGLVLLQLQPYWHWARSHMTSLHQGVKARFCLNPTKKVADHTTSKVKKKAPDTDPSTLPQGQMDNTLNEATVKPVTQSGPIATIVDRKTGYIRPHASMLNQACSSSKNKESKQVLAQTGQVLQSRLLDFNVQGQVSSVHPGPVVTRYEFQPAPGVRASKITSLSSDIARSLSKTSVRVVEVIPGKTTIGIEIPNAKREMVHLKDIIDARCFHDSKSPLTMALGKDISGQPVVADLAKMPHLLVAGTTGSGKSVGLNAMLLSLLYKATPDQLRLILIDPKMLELSVYAGIPHLLAPVITDMHEASTALRWCVGEMERRYALMAAVGVRNLAGYNDKIKQCRAEGSPLLNPLHVAENGAVEYLDVMPSIVVLADEFADMMMVVGKEVEQLIARIAQKARAAGIHLILATQRPSVDVITGLIKANIPSRIAFQVSSKIDSRTIIDQQGADQLLGHGDMLYLPPGTALPTRVHGAYVDDDEVHRVVAELSKNKPPTDLIQLDKLAQSQGSNAASPQDEQDEMYQKAVEVVMESKKASISYVQRRLKIGYNRAATIIEKMEERGLICPPNHKGQREVNVD